MFIAINPSLTYLRFPFPNQPVATSRSPHRSLGPGRNKVLQRSNSEKEEENEEGMEEEGKEDEEERGGKKSSDKMRAG